VVAVVATFVNRRLLRNCSLKLFKTRQAVLGCRSASYPKTAHAASEYLTISSLPVVARRSWVAAF